MQKKQNYLHNHLYTSRSNVSFNAVSIIKTHELHALINQAVYTMKYEYFCADWCRCNVCTPSSSSPLLCAALEATVVLWWKMRRIKMHAHYISLM